MTSEELQSKTISWLRFPLAFAIVLNHTVDTDELMTAISQIDYSRLCGTDIYNYFRLILSDIICRVATPCFCIFSGFLFFYKTKEWNRNTYFQKIRRKTRTLVIPYTLWNIIPIVIMAFFTFIMFDGSFSIYMNQLWEKGILKIFWNYHEGLYPYNLPLWFLRDLIVVAFLSPLVYYFVKYTKLYSLFILGVFYFTNFWFPVVSIRALFFFTLGAYFSIHGKNMVVELRKGKQAWIILTVIVLILSMYFKGTDTFRYVFVLFNVAGCITAIIVASYLIESGRVSVHPFLSKTSFFIFATHHVYLLWNCQKLLHLMFTSDNALILTMKYILAPVICVAICLGLYYTAKKTVPNLLNILTGSR